MAIDETDNKAKAGTKRAPRKRSKTGAAKSAGAGKRSTKPFEEVMEESAEYLKAQAGSDESASESTEEAAKRRQKFEKLKAQQDDLTQTMAEVSEQTNKMRDTSMEAIRAVRADSPESDEGESLTINPEHDPAHDPEYDPFDVSEFDASESLGIEQKSAPQSSILDEDEIDRLLGQTEDEQSGQRSGTKLTISFVRGVTFDAQEFDLVILPYHGRGVVAEFADHALFDNQELQSALPTATNDFSAPYALFPEQRLLLIQTQQSATYFAQALRTALSNADLSSSAPNVKIIDFLDYTSLKQFPRGIHLDNTVSALEDTTSSVDYSFAVTATAKPGALEELAESLRARAGTTQFDTVRVLGPDDEQLIHYVRQESDDPPPGQADDTRPHFLADHATDEDLLGYFPYAAGIAAFVRDPRTQLPLTIAIDGAWGKGKSSLMKMLMNELDPNRPEHSDLRAHSGWLSGPLRALWQSIWPKVAAPFRAAGARLKALVQRKKASADTPQESPAERQFVTVFVNAWRHGHGTQLKATMVNEIICNLAQRFGPEFLLSLELRRIDRMRLMGSAIKGFMTHGVTLFLAVLASAILLFSSWTVWDIPLLSWNMAIIPADWRATLQSADMTSGGIAAGLSGLLMLWKKIPSPSLEDYLDRPDYLKLMGDAAHVEEDFRRVLSALKARDLHLALFVDDLDRCSPAECAAVVEALNTFFGGERSESLFILGMHREMVASALEVAYHDLVQKIEAGDKPELAEQRPFGRRFLEKIVQFVVTLPDPDDEATEDFLDALTSGKKRGELKDIKALQAALAREQEADKERSEAQAAARGLEKAASRRRDMGATLVRLWMRTIQKIFDMIGFGIGGAIATSTAEVILNQMEKRDIDVEQATRDAEELAELNERIEERKNADENQYVEVFKQVKDAIRANPRQYKRFFNRLRFYRFLNVGAESSIFADACEAVLALEHPDLHYRIEKRSGSFEALAMEAAISPTPQPPDLAELTKEIDSKPGLKTLREALANYQVPA